MNNTLNEDKIIHAFSFTECSPEMQLTVLQILLKDLKEPILDIGCGHEMKLVKYLRQLGFQAFGIDSFEIDQEFYQNTDWFNFHFEPNKWGSIISNLGFSNHFKRHISPTNEKHNTYMTKYLEILNSLQLKGSFYYSPELVDIEINLDPAKFSLINKNIEGYMYKSTQITRLE